MWLIFKLFKWLFFGKAKRLLGGLRGKDLSSVATALLGGSGAKLPALVDKFKSAGLGQLVDSWVGKGANQAVTGAQVKSALDPEALTEVATTLGVSEDAAAEKVSGFLPALIDKLTPDGLVPDEQVLAKRLKRLMKSS